MHFLKALYDSGILQVIIMTILTVFVIPLIRQASAKQKNAKVKEAYDILGDSAINWVTYEATQYEKPSDKKRIDAIQKVSQDLADHKVNLNSSVIEAAIEKAYQHFATLNTKAQVKQQEYDEGLKEAAKQSAQIKTAEKNVEPKQNIKVTSKTNGPVTDEVIDAVIKRLNEVMGDTVQEVASSASADEQAPTSKPENAAEPASQSQRNGGIVTAQPANEPDKKEIVVPRKSGDTNA